MLRKLGREGGREEGWRSARLLSPCEAWNCAGTLVFSPVSWSGVGVGRWSYSWTTDSLILGPTTCPDGSDFWKSVRFTDYSQHSQMAMALTLRCPLKLEASLCQRRDPLVPCETLPNATAQESEGVRTAPSLQNRGGQGWGPETFSLSNSPLFNSGMS